jgi:heme/copper-type cytochrome/quinol oxidase subunit 2
LGIKIDACPGRLNKTALFIKREGLYYGQCSELCGTNHGFMPIGIASANITEYFNAAKALTKDFESVLLIAQS